MTDTINVGDLARLLRCKLVDARAAVQAAQTAREAAGRQLNGAVSLVRCVIEATKLELADRIDVGCDDDACDRVLSGKFVSVRVRYDDASGDIGEPVTVLELWRDMSGAWHYVSIDGRSTSDGFATARAAAAAALADDALAEQVAIKLAKLTS